MSPITSRRRRLVVAALASTSVVVIGAIGLVWINGDPVCSLIDAVGPRRVVEGRLSRGFSYAPRGTPRRAIAEEPANLSLLASAGALQKRVEADPNSQNLWAFGVAQLLLGGYDDAIRDLNDAVVLTTDARLLSDLAAAHLERSATGTGTVEDLARAIEASERAIAIDPKLPEARFNKALALERSGFTVEAASAWDEYISLDSSSHWAEEARVRSDALRSATLDESCLELATRSPEHLADRAATCPQEAREYGESLAGEWAQSTAVGDRARASAALALLDRVGASLASVSGDRLLVDTAAILRDRSAAELAMVRGHTLLERGRMLYEADRRDEALAAFTEARDLLRAAGNPFWLSAQHAIARVLTHRRELIRAVSLQDEVDRVAAARSYIAIRARVIWLKGVATVQQADASNALVLYGEAVALFERLGETGNVSNVMNAVADTERILGDSSHGWRSLSKALQYVNAVGDPTRRYLLYYNATLFARREGLDFAALHYQRKALSVARDRIGPVGVIEASINYAAVLSRLGRFREAEETLDGAEAMLPALEEGQPRVYQQARIAATKAELLMEREPARAIEQLEMAIDAFALLEPAELPRLELLKGTALLQAGDDDGAARSYLEGIRRFEARVDRVRTARQRISYSDEGWDLYRKLAALELSRNRIEDALVWTDRGRSIAGVTGELSLVRLRRQLDQHQAMLHYTVLNDDVHAWVIQRDSVVHRRLDIDAATVRLHGSRIARSIDGRGSLALLDESLRALYDGLIAPLALTSGSREVLIVPDAVLADVPFAALRDKNGRYLVEDTAVILVPSAGELAAGSGRSSVELEDDLQLLAVGNPVIDSARWPGLRSLPFAAREAGIVASRYRRSTLLVGAQATKAGLVDGLPSADVFHFAGHAIANNEFPELSRLLLSATAVDTGELTVADLQGVGIKRGALIVLSACETASGQTHLAGATESLARAFLSLGAGAVIGARWKVEDLDTSELMTTFHARLLEGLAPAAALQSAQVSSIKSRRPVSAWASFELFARTLH
ncbi:MAG TPA: CHAT domain-containing protein [Vicinamibacterales bacterium]